MGLNDKGKDIVLKSSLLQRQDNKIRVERFKLNDLPALHRFFDQAWDDPLFFRSRWNWQYKENPYEKETVSPIWVFKKRGEILGQIAGITGKLKVEDKIHDVLWLVDYKVIPRYEMMGIGVFILDAMEKEKRLLLGLGINDSSKNIFKSMGWGGERMLSLFIAEADKIIDQSKMFKHNLPCSNVQNIELQHGEFFQHITQYYSIIGWKSYEFLKWRYQCYDYFKHHIIECRDETDLRGVIFLRCQEIPNHTIGSIVDIWIQPDDIDAINSLLLATSSFFRKENIQKIRCYISDNRIQHHLLRLGFSESPSHIRFMIKNNDPLVSNDILEDKNAWFLTMADSDIGTLRR